MFPTVKLKKYQDLLTGKVVTVIDQFEDVAILDGKQRVNIKKLLDSSLYEEYIDPEAFLNGPSLMTLAEKIRSIPNEVLANIKSEEEVTNESLVIPYDEEEERMRLMEKARSMSSAQSMQNQLDKFSHLIDQDEIIPVVEQRPTQTNVRIIEDSSEYQTDIKKEPELSHLTNTHLMDIQDNRQANQAQDNTIAEDPIHRMFKNIKRKNNFTFTLTIEDKIPRPDFIEMMEDSYEISLIDYLAQEFTTKLLSDPDAIKEKIKQEITSLVFPDEGSKVVEVQKMQPETKPKTSKKKNDSPITN